MTNTTTTADRLRIIADHRDIFRSSEPKTVAQMAAELDDYNAAEAEAEAAFMRRYPGVL
ncbi:hypothetical protein SEA_HONK_31 [Microbacterium phage Honk]|uniref:Uncharacterized protein n=1 Tax=Microbacterium phage Honk TaxID=2836095 RepID=A0A8F3EA90_9CAUD|nr:hypothetical protein SEA_HONK_31 [Microbacterium phage Honk]